MRIKTTLGITTFALLPFLIASCSSDAPPSSIYTINATGGLGGADDGLGGNGNNFEINKQSGTGNAEVLRSGNANAGFSAVTPTANLGANPLAITANTTIAVVTIEPATGTPYFVADDSNLYISDGNATLESDEALVDRNIVTGLSVASGFTLTLGLNTSLATQASLSCGNDIRNSGTITTADVNATNRGDLFLYPDSYIGATGSSITTAGILDSQNGGGTYISTDNGSIYNHGSITTRGSNSAAGNGGSGGAASLNSNYNLQNTASITTRGGDAPAGVAGNGGNMVIQGNDGFMQNSGDLSSFGGNGGTGGSGGFAYLYAWSGDLLNSGDSDSHGGNGTTGNGGRGYYFSLDGYGGDIVNNANINASGGDTTAVGSSAGDGGYVYFYAEYADITSGYTPVGSILVSGNINTSGGDALATGTGSGGAAGYVYAEANANDYPSDDSRVAFLGYASVNTSGGSGNHGGFAGYYQISNNNTWDEATDSNKPSGNVTNEINVTARGGNAVATATAFPANGGRGGGFTLETDYSYGYAFPDLEMVTNTGNVDLSGGSNLRASSNSSGRSGYTWIWGYNGVTNSGRITSNAGSDADTDGGVTGYGGYANDIDLWAETGSITNSAALTNNGGNGEYSGGYSNGIELYGATVKNTANLTTNGGNASTTLAAAQGGNGGWIEMFSPQGPAGVSHSGTISQTAGAGTVTTNTDAGSFIKGGLCVSGPCN